MADSVKVIVKDNQEVVSLFIGTNTGQWVTTSSGISYDGGGVVHIGDDLEVAGNMTIDGDIIVDGDSTFQEVSTLALSCEGFDSSGRANLDGGARIFIANEYTDNADAIAGGLSIGEVYRTGDLMKIVH